MCHQATGCLRELRATYGQGGYPRLPASSRASMVGEPDEGPEPEAGAWQTFVRDDVEAVG